MTQKVKERLQQKKDVQVIAEKKLKEIDLGTDPQKLRPISISSKLSKEEKAELILLLKEFRDVFTWEYSEMPGLDLAVGAIEGDEESLERK